MKKLIPALLMGLVLAAGQPASAQTGQDFDMRFDVSVTPLHIYTSNPGGVVDGNLTAITLGGEGRVWQGLLMGGSYSFGGGNSMTLNGVPTNGIAFSNQSFSDSEFRDFKFYMKIPFNWQAFADSGRTMGPRPAYSPVYAYLGYKNTTLSAQSPATLPALGRLNIESASGAGLGLGTDVQWDPVGVYGQFVYYPTLFTKNMGFSTTATDGFLRAYEYDLGLRVKFGQDSPVSARIGYHGESHQAQNVNLNYSGFQFGASAEF